MEGDGLRSRLRRQRLTQKARLAGRSPSNVVQATETEVTNAPWRATGSGATFADTYPAIHGNVWRRPW